MTPARDSHVLAFDAERHAYTLDGASVPSVTKITGMLNAPGLNDWRARTGYQEAQRIAEEAAAMGHAIHAAAAAIARGIPLLPLNINERFSAAVELVGNYLADNLVEAFWVEEPMASVRRHCAGVPDLVGLFRHRRLPLITDYKSGSGVYLNSVIQLAGYRIIVKEWHGVSCDRLILHLPAPDEGKAPSIHPIYLRRHSADEAAFDSLNVLWRRSQEALT